MCEILEHIDFGALKNAEPKWFMGYSDNTNLTYLLATLCDTAAIYGPGVGAFGMEPWHTSIQDAFDVLNGKKITVTGFDKWEKESLKNAENPLVPYNVTEERVLKSYVGNQLTTEQLYFTGRLLGGCMDCLVNLLGTRYDKTVEFVEKYKEDGIIWFLESCDLNVFSIRRAMWQMEQAGWFQYVKGFLIGRPLCYGQEIMGLDAYDAVLKVAGKFNVPVIMDLDIGHLAPMMPIIVGSMGEVNVSGNYITLSMQ
jgi:muramoyltetrapeptide carboxypeptidase LdcA involved in peptidoglycan recycling